jgi:hypothetical protein
MTKFRFIWNFIKVFIISFVIMETIEYLINKYFNINLHQLKWGWLGFIIFYGFKYHVLCCIIPAIYSSYKCKHKNKCKHDYCHE